MRGRPVRHDGGTTGGTPEGGFGAVWGRGAVSRFDAREGELVLDGEVTSAMLGADFTRDRGTAGLMLSHSRGEGGYRGADEGTVSSNVTGLYPYGRYEVNERVSVLGGAGYGAGELVLTPKDQAALDAETGFGVDVGGGLAWVDPGSGLSGELSARGLLTHEAGGLRDRGVAGSLAWDPEPQSERGFSLTLSQTMGAHASGGMDALLGRGTLEGLAANDGGAELDNRRLELKMGYGFGVFAGRFTATPEAGLGLSDGHREVSIGGRLGFAGGGPVSMELGLAVTQREAANDDGAQRPVFGPGLSDSHRQYSLGWRLGVARGGPASLELGVEATRREAANDDSALAHEVGLRVTARW